jgi:hypothetical protein
MMSESEKLYVIDRVCRLAENPLFSNGETIWLVKPGLMGRTDHWLWRNGILDTIDYGSKQCVYCGKPSNREASPEYLVKSTNVIDKESGSLQTITQTLSLTGVVSVPRCTHCWAEQSRSAASVERKGGLLTGLLFLVGLAALIASVIRLYPHYPHATDDLRPAWFLAASALAYVKVAGLCGIAFCIALAWTRWAVRHERARLEKLGIHDLGETHPHTNLLESILSKNLGWDLGTPSLPETITLNVVARADGTVVCPCCLRKFPVSDAQEWDGERHLACRTRLSLNKEGKGAGADAKPARRVR